MRARGSVMRSLLAGIGSSLAALYCCERRPVSSATCTQAPSESLIAVWFESEPLALRNSSALATCGDSSDCATLIRLSRFCGAAP